MTTKTSRAAPASGEAGGTRKAAATRAEILYATAKMLGEKGYAACTLRALATTIDLKPGSVYYHFSSKEEIVDEVMNTGVELLLSAVTQALEAEPAGASFRDRFAIAVRAHLSAYLDGHFTAAYMHIHEHLPTAIKRRSRTMRRAYATLWSDLFAEGVRTGEVDPDLDLRLFVPFLLGGLNRVHEWFRPHRTTITAVTDMVVGTHMAGIGTAAPASPVVPARTGKGRPRSLTRSQPNNS